MAKENFSEEEILQSEKIVLERMAKSLPAIENALAVWDATKKRPAELEEKMESLRKFHASMVGIARKIGAAKKKGGDRLALLREFVSVCYLYENA
jgi:hypothetical protein